MLSLTVAIVSCASSASRARWRATSSASRRTTWRSATLGRPARARSSPASSRSRRPGSRASARGDLLSRMVADVDALQDLYLRGLLRPLVAVARRRRGGRGERGVRARCGRGAGRRAARQWPRSSPVLGRARSPRGAAPARPRRARAERRARRGARRRRRARRLRRGRRTGCAASPTPTASWPACARRDALAGGRGRGARRPRRGPPVAGPSSRSPSPPRRRRAAPGCSRAAGRCWRWPPSRASHRCPAAAPSLGRPGRAAARS